MSILHTIRLLGALFWRQLKHLLGLKNWHVLVVVLVGVDVHCFRIMHPQILIHLSISRL